MLNSMGQRMLAYTARCGPITPIEGADNIDLMKVNGWSVIVKKGEFQEGDLCVYFEIDSKLPKTEWSAFLANRNYKIKTMKLSRFGVISQGLALPLSILPLKFTIDEENVDCTNLLGVTYAVSEDNQRKSPDVAMQSMRQRHKKLLKKFPFKQLMRYETGRKILFLFLGKKQEKKDCFSFRCTIPRIAEVRSGENRKHVGHSERTSLSIHRNH